MAERRLNMKKKKDIWKILFFALTGIIIGVILFLVIRVVDYREPQINYGGTETQISEPAFKINLKKSQANNLINFFLEDFQKNSDIKYSFTLDNKALLTGKYTILGYDIMFYIYLDPYVLENGDLQLVVNSISIGSLSLPASELLSYVEKKLQIPEWVEIDSENETIVLHLSEYTLANGMHFKVQEINLLSDILTINVYLPE